MVASTFYHVAHAAGYCRCTNKVGQRGIATMPCKMVAWCAKHRNERIQVRRQKMDDARRS